MKKLIILDHFLTDNKGHDEQYDFSIAREAIRRGIKTEIWCPKRKEPQPDFVRQRLRQPFWKRANALGKIFAAISSVFEWRSLFSRSDLDNDTIALVQTTKFPILLFLSLGLIGVPVKSKLVIVIRRGIDNVLAKMLMKYLYQKKKTVFLSDSELITQELMEEGFDKAKTLPIPHLPPRERPPQKKDQLIGYFGEARYDKGFDVLPGLIEEMLKADQNVSFLIQSNVHRRMNKMTDIVGQLFRIRDMFPTRVEIIDGYVSDLEYAAYMNKCAVVLFPYRAMCYGKGTSGILAEGIACGCWIVVPSGTWMSAQKVQYQKIVSFEQLAVADLIKAIERCFAEEANVAKDRLRQQIDRWYDFHSPKKYVDILLESTG